MALRVFLVEDVLGTQALMKDLFSTVGGIELVGTAQNEGEAKLWLDESPAPWDVAVLDLVLQAGSGFPVITRCKERKPAGKVAIFSSYLTPTIGTHCLKLGADVVFNKEDSEAFLAWLLRQSLGATLEQSSNVSSEAGAGASGGS